MAAMVFDCDSTFTPIVLNNALTRVCGTTALDGPALESCCDGNNVQNSGCFQYCTTNRTLSDFISCFENGMATTAIGTLNPFCQGNITSNVTETLSTSAGTCRATPPRARYIFWTLALILLYVSNASATTIHSLSPEIGRRQSVSASSCAMNIASNYTSTGSSQKVGPTYMCNNDKICTWSIPVMTDILRNNRTVNGTSAAEPQYDTFFEMLQNATGRMFPALSAIDLQYEYMTLPNTNTYAIFSPYQWCANGTVSNCANLLGGTNDTMFVDVCGPLFVSDSTGTTGTSSEDEVIQGVFNAVESS